MAPRSRSRARGGSRPLRSRRWVTPREARRWDVIADAARREIGWHDATRRDADVWFHRAHAAGAALATGDVAPRADLIDKAARHPEALRALVLCELAQDRTDDLSRLE